MSSTDANQTADDDSVKISGFLNKVTAGPFGGQTKKKYWFVLCRSVPVLFWYKNRTDTAPFGKIDLSLAAFTFDPKERGQFEIRCGTSSVHVFEALNNKERIEWLHMMQSARRRAYSYQDDPPNLASTIKPKKRSETYHPSGSIQEESLEEKSRAESPLIDLCSDIENAESGAEIKESKEVVTEFQNQRQVSTEKKSTPKNLKTELLETNGVFDADAGDSVLPPNPSSTFYLTESGGLNENSLQMVRQSSADLKHGKWEDFYEDLISTSEELISTVKKHCGDLTLDEPKQTPNRSGPHKILRLPSLSRPKICENCKELISVVQTLKERCYDLIDELGANKELVDVLRKNIIATKAQLESLRQYSGLSDSKDRVQFILDREVQMTALQIENSRIQLELHSQSEKNKELEVQLSEMNSDLEAYKDSIRTKEQLIMNIVEKQEDVGGKNFDPKRASKLGATECDLDVGLEIGMPVITGDTKRDSAVSETPVDDLNQVGMLQDLLNGYQTQNTFLNEEIIEMQKMVQKLEEHDRKLMKDAKINEGLYFQLKSKYVLLLRHFKQQGNQVFDENQMSDLQVIANLDHSTAAALADEPTSPGADVPAASERARTQTDDLGFYLANQALSNVVSLREGRSSGTFGQLNKYGAGTQEEIEELLITASNYTKKSVQVLQEAKYNEYDINWITRWDGFLVNFSESEMGKSSPEMKTLLRSGVPHAYRSKVWKNLVMLRVKDSISELGPTYYQTLLKRTLAKSENSYDRALKQIDLDLARTLPGNKHFEDPEAAKMDQLRRVLYAYRWHNRDVGYCQGMNRIAAIALLYLDESDAFWFLVACIEYLQPPDYYTKDLLGALADQKVLADLIEEKLPKISHLLRQFDTDLSLFTLSWFLTFFVDTLSHSLYLRIFDVFLYEGNKVLFRFALSLLKLCESQLIACKSATALHSCLTKAGAYVTDHRRLMNIAFKDLNPFPMRFIETRREQHLKNLKTQIQSRSETFTE